MRCGIRCPIPGAAQEEQGDGEVRVAMPARRLPRGNVWLTY
jgi:hypothetical protein